MSYWRPRNGSAPRRCGAKRAKLQILHGLGHLLQQSRLLQMSLWNHGTIGGYTTPKLWRFNNKTTKSYLAL